MALKLRLLLLTLAVASCLTCVDDQVYIKVTKQCKLGCSEESFDIKNGDAVVASSPTMANNELRAIEYCIPSNEEKKYAIVLKDSYGDSWSSQTWVQIEGIYGNIVLKTYMSEDREETFDFVIRYLIEKNQSWKVTSGSSIDEHWADSTFDDSTWTDMTLGTSNTTLVGTQYYRKSFKGVSAMASYELSLNYRYGIVAYINGEEVYRDNMPSGTIESTTPNSNSYNVANYHSIIRSGSEIVTSDSILAVEVHFDSTESENEVVLDAFISVNLASVKEDNCYVYPYTTTFSSYPISSSAKQAFDFSPDSYLYMYSTPGYINYNFNGPNAVINGVRIYPGTSIASSPSNMIWQGSYSSTKLEWKDIVTVSDAVYAAKECQVFRGYFNTGIYKAYRARILKPTTSTFVYINEVQPLVCHDAKPVSIKFPQESYSVYAQYENVDIHPVIPEFKSCTVSPELPEGLTLNEETCSINGKGTGVLPETTFTMTSTMNGHQFTGTFKLQIMVCEGNYVQFLRTYKYASYREAFSVREIETNTTILSVLPDSGQPSAEDWSTYLCLTGSRYEIVLDSTSNYWGNDSHLYIRSLLTTTETETVARIRYDTNLGLPTKYAVNLKYDIPVKSEWHYKMGSLPENWYNDSVQGWEKASQGSFPASSNQIQLYKKTFNVDSLANAPGFVLNLRYKHGCVVYLNGNEVFRNGVSGELTADSTSENVYNDILYRHITLPVKTYPEGDIPSKEYIKEGSNTIAIALIAINTSQKESVFDCALRLMGGATVSRISDYTVTSSGIIGSVNNIADLYYSNSIKMTSCKSNHWTITFEQDRREWFSSLTLMLYYSQSDEHPRQFLLKARNGNTEDWTLLRNITGMTWSIEGQHKRLWIENNKPWNQYRLEDIGTGKPNECAWKLGGIEMDCDITTSAPALTYPESFDIVKGIEMAEVYPNSDYYYDFTTNPKLPEGIVIDSNNGVISGTATEFIEETPFTISAKKFGESTLTTCIVKIKISTCSGTKGLITLVARTDNWPNEGYYKIHEGKTVEGKVIASLDHFKAKNALNYGDFCLNNGIYTLEIGDSRKDGWTKPAGYYLTVDIGEMILDTSYMKRGVEYLTSVFTSSFPFQVEYSDWKLMNAETPIAEGWTSIDFDDSTWETKKANDFGLYKSTTAYIRHEVTIPDIADYPVLNIRMKYTGGVVAYFNGKIVARFNLKKEFDANTEALELHDATLFSKFHVITATEGITGKNMMAFEIHRFMDQSELLFDATGIFGAGDCPVVVDTYSNITATEMAEGDVESLFDLRPQIFSELPNILHANVMWTVENLEGSTFNTFTTMSPGGSSSYGFSVYGRWSEDDEFISGVAVASAIFPDRERKNWPMEVAITGFREFKFEIDKTAYSSLEMAAFISVYRTAESANLCPAIDDYPAVTEGQISPARCPYGMRGYLYRKCKDGQLGEVQSENCKYKAPENLAYNKEYYSFVAGTQVTTGKPTYSNIVSTFYMQDDTPLPEGLEINSKTGEIKGIPINEVERTEYVVRAKNDNEEAIVSVVITVRRGICYPEGVFEKTYVNEIAVYDCATQGAYVGTVKRGCLLGKEDGVWQNASGFCMPIYGIVLGILFIIAVVVVIVFILVRSLKKTKAVGGVKGRKDRGKMNMDLSPKSVKV